MKTILSIFLIFLICSFASAQTSKSTVNDFKNQYDLIDLLRKLFKGEKPRGNLDTSSYGKVTFTVLPGVSYNPATGFLFGASSTLARYYGSPKNTNLSSASLGGSYTTQKQFKFSLQSGIFTSKNEYSIQGDWRLWLFSQNTYGLGTGTDTSAQEFMDFNLLRFHQSFLRRFTKYAYAGIGFNYDQYAKMQTNINDESDSVLYPSFNSTYSKQNGFDSVQYQSSGPTVMAMFDSRDNQVSTYKGVLIELTYLFSLEVTGSSSNYQQFRYNIKAFQSLDKNSYQVLGLWLLGNIISGGTAPYMVLPAIGWDKYGGTGRGYVQGRFRGKQFMYGETELRLTLTRDRLFGIAIFGNATTMSNEDDTVQLFDYLRYGYGIGARILFDKFSRTNICVDYGRGYEGSSGVFLTLGQFF